MGGSGRDADGREFLAAARPRWLRLTHSRDSRAALKWVRGKHTPGAALRGTFDSTKAKERALSITYRRAARIRDPSSSVLSVGHLHGRGEVWAIAVQAAIRGSISISVDLKGVSRQLHLTGRSVRYESFGRKRTRGVAPPFLADRGERPTVPFVQTSPRP